MNVIDALAIAPYYVSLLLFDEAELVRVPGEVEVSLAGNLTAGANTETEEGGSSFGDVSRIIQVRLCNFCRPLIHCLLLNNTHPGTILIQCISTTISSTTGNSIK